MRPVITPAEANRLDQAASEPVEVLMDRAGLGVALTAVSSGIGYGHKVVVLVGPGNNGGDGYVAARYLAERGVQVKIKQLFPPRTKAGKTAYTAVSSYPEIEITTEIGSPDLQANLIIDAVFGGGFGGQSPAELIPWTQTELPLLAVDFPTGLNPTTGVPADLTFRADTTVTFGALRSGHILGQGPELCGQVHVVDIGWGEPQPLLRMTEAQDAPRPSRKREAHKWSAGSVLVVGGTTGMSGAAILTGKAALNFGAGSVGVATPCQQIVSTVAPELLTYEIGEATRLASRFETLVIGPGLGRDYGDLVLELIAAKTTGSVVIDADALTMLTPDEISSCSLPLVLTPHAGEFTRMTGIEPGWETAQQKSKEWQVVLLLKGNPTFIADQSGAVWVNPTGGPELATIGTGDVLAGMIGALLSQGLAPAIAARSAAFWHGTAGANLARHQTLTADRLATTIGQWSGVRSNRSERSVNDVRYSPTSR